MGVTCNSTLFDFTCSDPEHSVPWCAPGTAPVHSPCGIISGGDMTFQDPHGRDMLDLETKPVTSWVAGETAQVG